MKRVPARNTDPCQQPLLGTAEIAALLAQGRRLAQRDGAAPADSGRHGGRASRHLGSGLDFAEHRHYQPGDDVRRMDWRVTARTGQAHVRRYHEDLLPDCVLLVDRRASMRFATRGQLKVTQAVRLALLLAGLQTARQAPLGVLALDTRQHTYGPLGALQLAGLGHQLASPCPPIVSSGPSLGEALAQLARDTAPGARLILLSDFADADSVPATLWHRLASRHPVSAIAISDPAEVALPATGQASLCWNDDYGEHRLSLDSVLKDRLQQQYQLRQATLADTLGDAGIPLLTISTTDTDLLPVLRRLQT